MKDIFQKVKDFITENDLIKENDVVGCALSGGADSVFMTYVLNKLSEDMNFKIIAIHINHMLRGEDSVKDEKFVEEFCKTYNIELKSYRICVEKYSNDLKISIEMGGREVRYKIYNDLRKNNIIDKCATGHHIDDDVETILMRLFNGTGIKGIEGINIIRDNFYIRPILFLRKNHEIMDFIKENQIKFRLDKSNLKEDYLRNKLRLSIMPLINKSFKKDITQSIMSFKKISSIENSFMNELVIKEIYNYVIFNENNVIIYDKILKLHVALIHRIIREVVLRFFGNTTNISYLNIETIYKLFTKKEGKYIEVKKGVYFKKHSNYIEAKKEINSECTLRQHKIVILNNDEIGKFKCGKLNELEKEFEFLNKKMKVIFTLSKNVEYNKINRNSSYYKYFDIDNIYFEISIRTRENGDVFKPFGMKSYKKLKDFFINEKVKDKNGVPLIIFDDNIGWIYGFRTSEDYKVSDFTNKVIKIQIINIGE